MATMVSQLRICGFSVGAASANVPLWLRDEVGRRWTVSPRLAPHPLRLRAAQAFWHPFTARTDRPVAALRRTYLPAAAGDDAMVLRPEWRSMAHVLGRAVLVDGPPPNAFAVHLVDDDAAAAAAVGGEGGGGEWPARRRVPRNAVVYLGAPDAQPRRGGAAAAVAAGGPPSAPSLAATLGRDMAISSEAARQEPRGRRGRSAADLLPVRGAAKEEGGGGRCRRPSSPSLPPHRCCSRARPPPCRGRGRRRASETRGLLPEAQPTCRPRSCGGRCRCGAFPLYAPYGDPSLRHSPAPPLAAAPGGPARVRQPHRPLRDALARGAPPFQVPVHALCVCGGSGVGREWRESPSPLPCLPPPLARPRPLQATATAPPSTSCAGEARQPSGTPQSAPCLWAAWSSCTATAPGCVGRGSPRWPEVGRRGGVTSATAGLQRLLRGCAQLGKPELRDFSCERGGCCACAGSCCGSSSCSSSSWGCSYWRGCTRCCRCPRCCSRGRGGTCGCSGCSRCGGGGGPPREDVLAELRPSHSAARPAVPHAAWDPLLSPARRGDEHRESGAPPLAPCTGTQAASLHVHQSRSASSLAWDRSYAARSSKRRRSGLTDFLRVSSPLGLRVGVC